LKVENEVVVFFRCPYRCGGTCSQLMSQVSGGKTGNRLRWSIPL